GSRTRKVSTLIVESLVEPSPCFTRVVFLVQEPRNLLAKCVGTQIIERDANYGKVIWQQMVFCEVVQRRNQLTFGEIAGGSEDHHHAWTRGLVSGSELVFQVGYRCRRPLASSSIGGALLPASSRALPLGVMV